MLTYATLIALPTLALFIITLWHVPHNQRSKIADVLLAGIVGGLVIGRLLHVLVQWRYFADRLDEAIRIQAGGLDWHGVVIGAVTGMTIVGKIRGVRLRDVLPRLAWGVPLIALGAWAGCAVASCAAGREVTTLADYPAWLVWDNADIYGLYAPRFAVQPLGMASMVAWAVLFVALAWYKVGNHTRFWLALVLVSVTMFGLGFLRGDEVPMWAGLRADQWLDGVMIVTSIPIYFFLRKRWRSS